MAIVSSRKAIHLKDIDRLNQRKTQILDQVQVSGANTCITPLMRLHKGPCHRDLSHMCFDHRQGPDPSVKTNLKSWDKSQRLNFGPFNKRVVHLTLSTCVCQPL